MNRTVYPIVGARFRAPEDQAALRSCRAGDMALLEREPENRYDPNAVRVWLSGHHVGYLPAAMMAKGLARMIDERGAPPAEGQTGRTMTGRIAISSDRMPLVEIDEQSLSAEVGGRQ